MKNIHVDKRNVKQKYQSLIIRCLIVIAVTIRKTGYTQETYALRNQLPYSLNFFLYEIKIKNAKPEELFLMFRSSFLKLLLRGVRKADLRYQIKE